MMEFVDPDFAAYVVARWPALVRTVVFLGARHDEAAQIVELALARCYPDWAEIGHTDRDVEVYRAVLHAASHQLGERHREPEPGVVADPTVPDPERAIEGRRAIEEALGGLPPAKRAAVVLRGAAELDETQVADVVGEPPAHPGEGPWTPAAFREAGAAIPVGQPAVTRVAARALARRRRSRGWTLGSVAALVLAIAVGTWLGTRPPEPVLPDAAVQRAVNPADVAWYANGVLHLRDVTVRLGQIVDLVEVPDGVVYADRGGRVVHVGPDGTLTSLGETVPGTRIVGSLERGLVAWVEREKFELVVHNVVNRSDVVRRPVPARDYPVALDQDRLYYEGQSGGRSFQLPSGEPEQVPGGPLLDVSSAVRAHREDDEIRIVQPIFDVDIRVPGEHADFSPDGGHVLTWTGEDAPRDFRVFATGSGEEVRPALAPDDVILLGAFGPDNTASFIVAHAPNEEDREEFMRLSASGPRLLVTCELVAYGELPPCRTLAQFSLNVGHPLLPH